MTHGVKHFEEEFHAKPEPLKNGAMKKITFGCYRGVGGIFDRMNKMTRMGDRYYGKLDVMLSS